MEWKSSSSSEEVEGDIWGRVVYKVIPMKNSVMVYDTCIRSALVNAGVGIDSEAKNCTDEM